MSNFMILFLKMACCTSLIYTQCKLFTKSFPPTPTSPIWTIHHFPWVSDT